jgi:hypothetical protein
MTERMAEAVSVYGYDAAHPPFNWEITPDGELDLPEDDEQ